MIVYKIENMVTGKIYIGRTTQRLKTRWAQHKSRSRSKYIELTKRANELYSDMNKYGIDNFICEQIDVADSIEELYEKELYHIKKSNSVEGGYNLIYGDLISSDKLNKEEIDHNNTVIGMGVRYVWSKISEEDRSKIARQTMHSISHEERRDYIQSIWDRMDKEERSIRIQKTVNSRLKNDPSLGKYVLIDPDGKEYDDIFNLTEFCKEHNIDRRCIYHVIRGACKQHKGWKVRIISKPKKTGSKVYTFLSPEGKKIMTKKLSSFCNEHSLSEGSIRCIIRGVCKQHKGWTLINIEDNDD